MAPHTYLTNYKKYNTALRARLVLMAWKRDFALPLLQSLHWLPVHARVDYKLCTLCHNCFSNSSPAYISELLTVYTRSRQLRSATNTIILKVPYTKTKSFGQRSSFGSPTQWNSLPCGIRHVTSTPSSKIALKRTFKDLLQLV